MSEVKKPKSALKSSGSKRVKPTFGGFAEQIVEYEPQKGEVFDEAEKQEVDLDAVVVSTPPDMAQETTVITTHESATVAVDMKSKKKQGISFDSEIEVADGTPSVKGGVSFDSAADKSKKGGVSFDSVADKSKKGGVSFDSAADKSKKGGVSFDSATTATADKSKKSDNDAAIETRSKRISFEDSVEEERRSSYNFSDENEGESS
jgi:hypothetical protein